MSPLVSNESFDEPLTLPNRRRVLAWALAGLGALAHQAAAADGVVVVAGQRFQRQVQVAGVDLQLNGTGVRGWYKAYAAGLYLPSPEHDAAQVVAEAGPKRLQLRMRFVLPASAFADAFRTGLLRNVSPAEGARLEPGIAAFEARVKALGKVHEDDVIDLDFDPARGLVFALNGQAQGAPIAIEGLYAAMLLAFIGPKPYDGKLKSGLLGEGG
jgi:hypothetical protein